MAAVKSLPKSRLGGLGLPSWFTKSLEDVYREKYGGRYPGLAENVAVGTGSALKAVGVPKHIAETAGRNVTSLVEDWTPAGALTATEEYGPVGGLAAVPIVGGKAKKLAKGLGGIKAYHGSPHSFEQFDISKIGTGEGAQAYGHGLYFAENEKTAKAYRDALKDRRLSSNEGAVEMGEVYTNLQAAAEKHGLHPDQSYQLVKQVQDKIDRGAPLDDIEYPVKKFNDAYYSIVEEAQRRGYKSNPGHMYEVDIAADPEAFLDWDKPLSEQSEHVRSRPGIAKLVEEDAAYRQKYPDIDRIAKGSSVPESVIREAGLPGIKYLDRGSRTGGIGSRNYVVFDPKIVSIVKKYGIPAAIASGLISEEMGRQMQAQGEI